MRVPGYGLIDHDRELSFTFDGAWIARAAGGTRWPLHFWRTMCAWWGRSFKYHRPRGILTSGSEEPNALVTALGVPNTRATMLELFEGLEAKSQNRWPSLRRDVIAINDLVAPFLSAGFYYKTFMWPRSFWERLYEPVIRRAAGLGRLEMDATDWPVERGLGAL